MKNKEENEEVIYDWKDLVAALRDVIDGALNAAAKGSSYEEEWDAISNVREFVYDWLEGQPTSLKLTDLLLVLGIILSAIEIELGIQSWLPAVSRATVTRADSANSRSTRSVSSCCRRGFRCC